MRAQEMLTGMAAGDERALAGAYEMYAGSVYGLALRMLGDASRAEEVTQDVFVAAWRHRAEFAAERGPLAAWLLAATRNRAIDFTRGRWGRQRFECAIPVGARAVANVEESVLRDLDRRALESAVATLPTEQRHVIEQVYFVGQTLLEIALAAGVPVSTIKGRLRMGRRRLARDTGLRAAIHLAVA